MELNEIWFEQFYFPYLFKVPLGKREKRKEISTLQMETHKRLKMLIAHKWREKY